MASNIFTVKNLSFAYGKQQVLKNLDLDRAKIYLRTKHLFFPR